MRPEDFIGLPRNTKLENELVEKLRNLPSPESLEFIMQYIELDYSVGLLLAKRVLSDPEIFREILLVGLERGDASTIKHWLVVCLPPLGGRRLVREIEDAALEKPHAVEKTLYWLPRVIKNITPEIHGRLLKIRAIIDEPNEVPD